MKNIRKSYDNGLHMYHIKPTHKNKQKKAARRYLLPHNMYKLLHTLKCWITDTKK